MKRTKILSIILVLLAITALAETPKKLEKVCKKLKKEKQISLSIESSSFSTPNATLIQEIEEKLTDVLSQKGYQVVKTPSPAKIKITHLPCKLIDWEVPGEGSNGDKINLPINGRLSANHLSMSVYDKEPRLGLLSGLESKNFLFGTVKDYISISITYRKKSSTYEMLISERTIDIEKMRNLLKFVVTKTSSNPSFMTTDSVLLQGGHRSTHMTLRNAVFKNNILWSEIIDKFTLNQLDIKKTNLKEFEQLLMNCFVQKKLR